LDRWPGQKLIKIFVLVIKQHLDQDKMDIFKSHKIQDQREWRNSFIKKIL